MKFLPQDMFETFSLALAKYKVQGQEDYVNFKLFLHEEYSNSFPGDNLWLEQAEAIVPDIIKIVEALAAKEKFRSLQVAMELRQKLDDDLNPPSATKKLLGGLMFTKSHPAPHIRKELAIKNIKLLFVKMAALGFQHR